MKKSEIYRAAQIAVINENGLLSGARLEIIRRLIHDEELAEFVERSEESEAADSGEL